MPTTPDESRKDPSAAPVVTIGCSGTSYDNNLCEIVAEFMKGMSGERYKHGKVNSGDWTHMHLYGVGSDKQVGRIAQKSRIKSTFLKKAHQVWDALSGDSMYMNIETAMRGLARRFGKNKDASFTLNLFGWSRGAVTCVGIANQVAKQYPHAHINLFLIDPVPGVGNNKRKLLTIPEQVGNLSVIYAQGESLRNPFRLCALQPGNLSVANPSKTNIQLIRTPGMHYSGAEHLQADTQKEVTEATVVWNCLHKFLTRNGVTLNNQRIHQHKVVGDGTLILPYEPLSDYVSLEYWSGLLKKTRSPRGQVFTTRGEEIFYRTGVPFCKTEDHYELLKKLCPELTKCIVAVCDDNIRQSSSSILTIVCDELDNLAKNGCQKTLRQIDNQLSKNPLFSSTADNNFLMKKVQECRIVAVRIEQEKINESSRQVNNRVIGKQFAKQFDVIWLRPTTQYSSRESWRNSIISICHSYVSSMSIKRHHKPFFKKLAKLCQNRRYNLNAITTTIKDYLTNNKARLNPEGFSFHALRYILSRIALTEPQHDNVAKISSHMSRVHK